MLNVCILARNGVEYEKNTVFLWINTEQKKIAAEILHHVHPY